MNNNNKLIFKFIGHPKQLSNFILEINSCIRPGYSKITELDVEKPIRIYLIDFIKCFNKLSRLPDESILLATEYSFEPEKWTLTLKTISRFDALFVIKYTQRNFPDIRIFYLLENTYDFTTNDYYKKVFNYDYFAIINQNYFSQRNSKDLIIWLNSVLGIKNGVNESNIKDAIDYVNAVYFKGTYSSTKLKLKKIVRYCYEP